MIVGVLLLRLFIPNSESLKDKRQVVKSLGARLTNRFGVSVAEVGEQDAWRTAELGIACVSNQVGHAERVLDTVVSYVEETRPDLEVIACSRDTLSPFD